MTEEPDLTIEDTFIIEDAELRRKLPYIQVAIGSQPIDPRLRWILEQMDCFGEYEVVNDVCSNHCSLAKGCEGYTNVFGL